MSCSPTAATQATWLRQQPEFITELTGPEKSLEDADAVSDKTGEARIINILSFFGKYIRSMP
jgi:hypothetical protein